MLPNDISIKNILKKKINLLKNGPYSSDISEALNSNSEDLKRIYLKGGEGIMMEIDLFKDSSGNDLLGEIKSKGWLINEANLTMYIDNETIDVNGGVFFNLRSTSLAIVDIICLNRLNRI